MIDWCWEWTPITAPDRQLALGRGLVSFFGLGIYVSSDVGRRHCAFHWVVVFIRSVFKML
jgi:hypothetical protein